MGLSSYHGLFFIIVFPPYSLAEGLGVVYNEREIVFGAANEMLAGLCRVERRESSSRHVSKFHLPAISVSISDGRADRCAPRPAGHTPCNGDQETLKARKCECNPAVSCLARLCGRTRIVQTQVLGGEKKKPPRDCNFIEDSKCILMPTEFLLFDASVSLDSFWGLKGMCFVLST